MKNNHGHAHTPITSDAMTLVPRTVKLSDSRVQALADAMLTGVKSTAGVVTLGTHMEKDVRCFRGKKLVEFLMDPSVQKKHAAVLGKIETAEDAAAAAQKLMAWRDKE